MMNSHRAAAVVLVFSFSFALGCSDDDGSSTGEQSCYFAWKDQAAECNLDFYQCHLDSNSGCSDDHDDCVDENREEAIDCAGVGSCLDVYLNCIGLDDIDADECRYDFKQCASWYEASCESECIDERIDCHDDLGGDDEEFYQGAIECEYDYVDCAEDCY